jgi:type IV pilus assembly protein PilC
MPNFAYKAHDKRSNKEVSDVIEAASQAEAIAAIKRMGLLPIEVKEGKGKGPRSSAGMPAKGGKGGFSLFGGTGVKRSQVTQFTRQLSTLQDAGLPIVQSLMILADMQRPGPFKSILAKVTDEVQGGTMLSEAMARHPRVWDRLYTNLVKAGETAGALEVILRRLADFREKAERLKRKVIGALIYPIAVMSIAIIILSFIMVFIIPKFEQIFKEMSVELPQMTVMLIDFSSFMASYWWVMLLAVIVAFVGLAAWRKTPSGAAIVDRLSLKIPVLGMIQRKGAVARLTRTLGTLVTSGVGFLDALDITKEATGNTVVRNAISDVRESVKEGETINQPLRRYPAIFDDIVINMVKVGEETGELDKMLVKIADNYDEEVDSAVAAMMSLLEPFLIVFMGVAVGFIVIALFLPLIKLIENIGNNVGK